MSDYKKRERRQVSFNTEDAVELELLKFVDRPDINFSGLVKNLLFAYHLGQLQPEEHESIAGKPESNVTPISKGKSSPDSSETMKKIKASGMPFDF